MSALRLWADPYISPTLTSRLRSLPFSPNDPGSIVLSAFNVSSVDFYGAANGASRFGHANWMGDGGVWLELKNTGVNPWANAVVEFSAPRDLRQYNAVTIWLKSSTPAARFWLDLQNSAWKQPGVPQARTEVLPAAGDYPNQVVQLVIPFTEIRSDFPFSFRRVGRLTLEFGQDTTGNPPGTTIQVLGVAFTRQIPALTTVAHVFSDGTARTIEQAYARAAMPDEPALEDATVQAIDDDGIDRDAAPASILGFGAAGSGGPAADYLEIAVIAGFSALTLGVLWGGFRAGRGGRMTKSGAPVSPAGNVPGDLPMEFGEGSRPPGAAEAAPSNSDPADEPPAENLPFDRSILRFNNPFVGDQTMAKELAAMRSRRKVGWLSPFQINAERQPSDEHHGESYLLSQVGAAAAHGVQLLPSLCFVRTPFNYERFLSNPLLYVLRAIPESQLHLSDDEIRRLHPGYFPVWIPPSRQRHLHLAQRVMLAYGRLSGAAVSNDCVQYDLRSSDLRDLAVRVLERVAGAAAGARLENAEALLSELVDRHWPVTPAPAPRSEFWLEVIQRVRAKFPHFMFIADGGSVSPERLLNVGFDFVENDRFCEVLLSQLRLRDVGRLPAALQDHAHQLDRYVHGIDRLVGSSSPAADRQNRMALMILSLLPGRLNHAEHMPEWVDAWLSRLGGLPPLERGGFAVLPSGSASVLSFVRWSGASAIIVAANFSTEPQSVRVRTGSLSHALEPGRMFLFSDALGRHANAPDVPLDTAPVPSAMLGSDIAEAGLALNLDGLSLKLLSVNLSRPLRHAEPQKIQQLHQA